MKRNNKGNKENAAPTPRLSGRLTPRQLWSMANDPSWRPWMGLIAGHPHAWPALREWYEGIRGAGLDFDAAGPAPAETDGTTKRERRERPDDGRASAPRRHGPRL